MNGNGSKQVNINIEKRNGALEAFDEEKLARGVSRSGTPFMMAKDIAKSIQKKIKENNSNNNTIRSSQIKEFVTEELKSRNENVIADLFLVIAKTLLQDYQQTINMIQRPVQLRDLTKKNMSNKKIAPIKKNLKAGSSS